MTSLFFTLLPVDLQIEILITWNDRKGYGHGLLRVLSALDCACARADQATLRALLTQLPPFGVNPLWSDGKDGYDALLVQWLSSRNVPLTCLVLKNTQVWLLDDSPPLSSLPGIETVYWSNLSAVDNSHLISVLQLCPNITKLQCKYFVQFTEDILKHTPTLQELIIAFEVGCGQVCEGIFPHLRVFRMDGLRLNIELATMLGKGCPLLEVLEARFGTTAGVLLMIQSCPLLRELMFHHGSLTPEAVLAILSCPQIKRLSADEYNAHRNNEPFANFLELRPDLEYLQLGGWVCAPAERSVSLPFSEDGTAITLDTTALDQLLTVCSPVTDLTIQCIRNLDENIAEVVVAKCREVKSLAMVCNYDNTIGRDLVITGCGASLTHVRLSGGFVNDELLPLLGKVGALLRDVELRATNAVTDIGLIALIAGCSRLHRLSLVNVFGEQITVKTLQAVVDHKLRLQQLELKSSLMSGLQESDKGWFREQLREHLLLPVPAELIW